MSLISGLDLDTVDVHQKANDNLDAGVLAAALGVKGLAGRRLAMVTGAAKTACWKGYVENKRANHHLQFKGAKFWGFCTWHVVFATPD
ncbi:hypothetical protein FOPE_01696 [Fonsecaea pedrosoi]|nr:hypothetical protein FOPE_01696 [Fonsecaea pedrosoi]